MDGSGSRRGNTFDLYVASIPGDLDEGDIERIFCQCGDIAGIQFLNSKPGYNTRVCFVKYTSEEDCYKAERLLNNYDVGCNKLKVRYQRKNRSSESDSFGNSNNTSPSGGFPHSSGGGHQNLSGSGFPQSNHSNKNAPWKTSNSKPSDSANDWDDDASSAVAIKKLIVTSVESPVQFWAQDHETEAVKIMTQISEELEEIGPKLTCTEADLQNSSSKVFGSIFHLDGMWYRCDILRTHDVKTPPGHVAVRYIDYGNVEVVKTSSLVCLPRKLSGVPPQAKPYILYDVQLVVGHQEGIDSLNGLIMEQMVDAIIHQEGSPCHVDIRLKPPEGKVTTVCQKLKSSGVLEKKVMKQELPQLENVKSPRSVNAQQHLSNGFPKQASSVSSSHSQNNKMLDDAKNEITSLKKQLSESQKQLQTIKDEKMSLQHTTETLKTEHENNTRKFVNDSLQKVTKEMTLLKDARNSPYLSDSIPSYLSFAMDIVCGEHSLKLDKFSKYIEVVTLKEDLLSCQTAIANCKELESLEELGQKRDQARQAYVSGSCVFLEEVKNIAVDERKQQLEKAQFDLERKHVKELLDQGATSVTVKEALDAWTTWKADVISRLADCRKNVNESAAALSLSLGKIVNGLDIASDNVNCEPTNVTVDEQIKNVIESINLELGNLKANNTDLEGSTHILNLVRGIHHEILDELNDINKFRESVLPLLTAEEPAISMWLTKKPDVSAMTTIRRTLKELRSKFRHLQADRRDVEESEDSTDEKDVEKIESAIDAVRREMHVAFVREADEMKNLADITKNHFPELALLHPGLNLAEYLRTNGTILCTRELEHYSHKPLDVVETLDRHTTILSSVFNNSNCILKEYLIDASLKVDTIQTGVIQYSLACHPPAFVPCDALFYDKVTRKLYLQTATYNNGTMVDFVASNPTHKDLQSLLQQLLIGIIGMQASGYLHGELTPENVFVNRSDEHGLTAHIGQPRFTDDVNARIGRTTAAFSGSSYPALPNAHKSKGSLFDVHCYACIALWTFYPKANFGKSFMADLDMIQGDHVALKDLLETVVGLDDVPSPCLAQQHVFFEVAHNNPIVIEEEQETSSGAPQEETAEQRDCADETPAGDDSPTQIADGNTPLLENQVTDAHNSEEAQTKATELDGNVSAEEKPSADEMQSIELETNVAQEQKTQENA